MKVMRMAQNDNMGFVLLRVRGLPRNLCRDGTTDLLHEGLMDGFELFSVGNGSFRTPVLERLLRKCPDGLVMSRNDLEDFFR